MLSVIDNAMVAVRFVGKVLFYQTANEFGPSISTGHEKPLANPPTVSHESACYSAVKSGVNNVEAGNIHRIV